MFCERQYQPNFNPALSYNSKSIEFKTKPEKFIETELNVLGCYRPHRGTNEEVVIEFSHVYGNLK